MLFDSISFLIFFPVVILLYFIIPHRFRYIWLLAASYYFYMAWNPVYALLMLTSTFITYTSGILIDKANKTSGGGNAAKLKNIYVSISFILNLSILFFFKYFYFAVDNINILLSALHIQLIQPKFDIILPLGISFYTMQMIAYIVDIYRGAKAETNFIKYALFISFFPKLLAGPIERTATFLPQLQERKYFNYDNLKNGLLLMLYGYFLKMVIGDRAAILVNFVFENYEAYMGLEIFVAITIYSIQIYADFFGYTCIAIGAAQTMGFTLLQNFNHPFFAVSVGDYWRRWHISLSMWLRDYIYFPLGGSRCSKIKKYRNILITFFISGLWHGANWTFIIWGMIHGLSIILDDIFKPVFQKIYSIFNINTQCFSFRLFQIIIAFLIINYSRLFFRAPDIETAVIMTKQMFSVWNPWIFFDNSLYDMGLSRKDFYVLCFSIIILWAVSFMQEKGIKIREELAKQNLVFRWILYWIAIFGILTFGVYGTAYNANQFIYFQF